MIETIVSSPLISPQRSEIELSQTAVLYGVALSAPQSAVEYEGDSVIFNRQNMKVGEPHVVAFRDRTMIAVKRQDNTIDFYYLPE